LSSSALEGLVYVRTSKEEEIKVAPSNTQR